MARQDVERPDVPGITFKLPKAVIRRLDPATVLLESLLAQKRDDVYGPVIALERIESYLNAARQQQRRIERAKATVAKAAVARRIRSPHRSMLFEDTHFYLICWSRIAKLMDHILNGVRTYHRSGRVRRRYKRELTIRVDGRDHLEHFEERLPGGKQQHRLRNQYDLWNMHGTKMSYGGRHLDVGPDSINLLQTIVAEFREALLYDALESLAEDAPERAAVLLNRLRTDVPVNRVKR